VADYFGWLRQPPAGDAGRSGPAGPNPGITVLVPTYTPAAGTRTASLRLCLASVRAAAGDLPVAVLVIDDGLSGPAARQVGELLRAAGHPHQVVPAAGEGLRTRARYTVAAARNAGLAFLAGQPPDSPLRQRWLLFLDDDTALAPPALRRLIRTLAGRDRAIAACPRVVPVPDLAGWSGPDPGGTPRRLPGALAGGGYDLLSVTSHGSLVTGRTVGLLVRQDPVLAWVGNHGPRTGGLFYADTPFGSTEDMLAMAVLSRLGELWSVPAAVVLDEARKTPGATRRQQFAWGYDHTWLARALAEAGLLAPGVHALAWHPRTGWRQHRAGWAEGGFLVNPTELRLGYRLLRALTADRSLAAELFGDHGERVRAGIPALGRVLRRWRADAGAVRTPRPDLPPLAGRDWASLRDGIDALAGHLAGNVAGSLDHAPYFLYGARQPASPS
jgi:glycosyltransferase involved in cell wall biosynthesis